MKVIRLFPCLLLIWMPLSVPAQALSAGQVPGGVLQGFQAKFPAVKAPAWKLKADKNYEAEFTLKGSEIAAKFDTTGKWLETESAIARSKVPKAVRQKVAEQFKGFKVVETQSVQRWDGDALIYELHLEKAREVVKVQYSAQGGLLNQSTASKPSQAK